MVEPTALLPFSAWENFYVIVGSSAAALTGLQFVVVVLGAEARSIRDPELGAFGTPTIVHFCAVLLISAIISVPWHAVSSAGLALGASGVAGIVYMLGVIRRARGQAGGAEGDKPGAGDWVLHTALSLLPYLTPLAAAVTPRRRPPPAVP